VVIAGPNLLDEVSRLKQAAGGELVIWGTGQLTDALAAAWQQDTCPVPAPNAQQEPVEGLRRQHLHDLPVVNVRGAATQCTTRSAPRFRCAAVHH
jgi:hypothetical protein